VKNTALKSAYTNTGVFLDKKWVHVTIIKKAKELWVQFKHPNKALLYHLIRQSKKAALVCV
jgi:hypothetical protein